MSSGSISITEHLWSHPLSGILRQKKILQKILTIALLAIVYMLIACFPTAVLILIKKYIWV